ncbi:MAG: hypothetical protein ACTMUB_07875 [cyanobacterium endosymbiont of Rhopalodia musculus]|uniref:hypothetical protein n=1 Tax=cyanobacterium endosymbiont of Epithemia clementina EcSB TaxID=3034674 RepID=UPI002480F582|nr:hypothetical protein [cyanobacterium endosymbiont of Epithemia clementina EcSB]WGT68004.1 hypothetical protein P3F56_02680 [cyanobacterium endosymbiont of Epithemia clementina EcSB]
MDESKNLVIVKQLCKVTEEGDYSLLSLLLTEWIRRHRLTLEQQLKAKFLQNKWVHVLTICKGKIARFQSHIDLVTLLGVSN